jgi:hypothetical protein
MAKQQAGTVTPAEVAAKMDSTAVDVKGKRVFYFLTEAEQQTFIGADYKNLAFVIGANLTRGPDGRIIDKLAVFVSTGNLIFVDAPSDSSRTAGTYDLFREGDLRN